MSWTPFSYRQTRTVDYPNPHLVSNPMSELIEQRLLESPAASLILGFVFVKCHYGEGLPDEIFI